MQPAAHRPRYLRIYAALRAAISGGEYRPGDRLPSYQTSARQFGVAGLPLRQAVDLLAREGLVTRGQGYGTLVVDHHPEGRRVLVADDDPPLRLCIRSHAEAAGYEVTEAQDGDAPVHAPGRASFSHVFTDLRMPAPGGVAIVRAAHPLQARAVIVVATGSPDDLTLLPSGIVARVLRMPRSTAQIRAALGHARQANAVPAMHFRGGRRSMTGLTGAANPRVVEAAGTSRAMRRPIRGSVARQRVVPAARPGLGGRCTPANGGSD